MKTLLFSALFAGSIGLNIYLLNSNTIVESNLDSDLIKRSDEVHLAQSAVKKTPKHQSLNDSHQNQLTDIRKKFLPESNPELDEKTTNDPHHEEEYNDNYTRQREAWRNDISVFLETELGLEDNEVNSYFDLQQERELKVSDFLSSKFDKNSNKTYIISMEDNIEIAKINQKYLKQLKQNLGEDNFEKYKMYKDNFNKEMMDAGEAYFMMEF